MKRWIVSFIFLYTTLIGVLYAKTEHRIDFTIQPNGEAFSWLKDNGFKSQIDADELICEFKDGALIIGTKKGVNGIFTKKLNLRNVSRIRIEWGMLNYPDGADWEQSVFREGIGVIVSFGDKKIDSGAFYIPNVPYFIGFFLGEREISGKAYVGNYYKKGGRYFCVPCGAEPGKTVVTEFDLNETFREQFGVSQVPPISGISIEADTRDTAGNSSAFIKKIEFLSD